MAVVNYQYRIDGGTPVDVGNVLTHQVTGLTGSTLYDFEVRAEDAAGNFSAWSNLESGTTDAAAVTPDTVTGLYQWLKADAIAGLSDGDPVATWEDSSVNNRDAAQSNGSFRPTYETGELNSLPIVRFNGAFQFLNCGNFSALTEGEVFVVVKIDNDPPGNINQAGLWTLGGEDEYTFYPFTDSSIYEDFGTNSRKTVGNPTPSLASWRIYNVFSAASDWGAAIDGTSISSTGTNTVAFPTDVRLGISQIGGGGAYSLDGDIAEFIMYDNKLASGDRTAIVTHLQGKYGL
jgi:hypothetical protein